MKPIFKTTLLLIFSVVTFSCTDCLLDELTKDIDIEEIETDPFENGNSNDIELQ